MAFGDGSEGQMAFITETVFGTTPATPAFKRLRFTGESLTYNLERQQSNEVRADATVSDLRTLSASAGGGIDHEWSFGTDFNEILEHALRGAFSTHVLKGGVLKKSLTFERKLVATADNYFRFPGCRINSMSMNVQPGAFVTGSLDVVGIGHTTAAAIITGATYAAGNSNPVMAAPDVATITMSGHAGSLYFTQLQLNVNNNLRAQPAIGQLAAAGVGFGQRVITGTLNAYFESRDLYDLYVSGANTSLSFTLGDGTNSYVVLLPKVKFATGTVQNPGNNQDVMTQITFQALYDSTEATDIKITKSS